MLTIVALLCLPQTSVVRARLAALVVSGCLATCAFKDSVVGLAVRRSISAGRGSSHAPTVRASEPTLPARSACGHCSSAMLPARASPSNGPKVVLNFSVRLVPQFWLVFYCSGFADLPFQLPLSAAFDSCMFRQYLCQIAGPCSFWFVTRSV